MRRRILLAAALLLAGRVVHATNCSPTTFVTAATYPAPAPSQVVLADFNHDGQMDIATAAYNGSSVSVLLNNGDGTFASPIVTNIGYQVSQIAAADLRTNGDADLLVTVYSGVAVLLGNGNGTFAVPVVYNTGYYPSSELIGRFDASGTLDVVVVDQSGSNLDFLPGNGDGTFGPAKSSPAVNLLSIASGDFDGDGKLDIVGTNGNLGVVALYPGTGDGHFGAPSNFIAGTQPGGIVAGDFDGDGNLDAATTTGLYVSVLLGNGNGTFQAALLYPAGGSPSSLRAGDFDADGIQDLAVLDPYLDTVSLLFGNGDGSFDSPAAYMGGSQLGGLAVGDVDGDLLPDVVSGNEVDAVVVFRNAGNGVLLAVPSSTPPGPYTGSALSVAAGDWNRDGRDDLAWPGSNEIVVARSLGAGRFEQVQSLTTAPNPQQFFAVAAGAFTGPGRADLVATDYNDVILFPGLEDGTFGAAQSVASPGYTGGIAAGDFDGDGRDDIAASVNCCGSQSILVYPGNGDGTFQTPVQTSVGLDASRLQPVDLNGDGRPDLLVTSNSAIYVLLSNGDGSFQPPTLLVANGGCCSNYWAAPGRFADGVVDILTSTSSGSVSIFPGNGDGTFGAPVQLALPSGGSAVAAGDYDGDGHGDFVVLSGPQTALLFPGLGNRHFQTPVAYPSSNAGALVNGHFGSGGLDVAAPGQLTTSTLLNAALGATVPSVSVLVGSPATLSASAGGYGPVAYQWRKNGSPIPGATEPVLVIDSAAFTDAGSYDVAVTDSCTSTFSNPATLSVEFADVPVSDIFHADIITIATAGITAGCGGADYCPSTLVTRAQMAVFLLKSEHGSAYLPPACSGLFADVPCPSTYADWIEQLSNEGVTAGCGNDDYCPDASVTRAQMAVFLLKTSLGSGYVPPAATAIFSDVPVDAFAAAFIDDLYTRGIAGGCSSSPLLYCPNNIVNRAPMAAFLVHTFF